MNRSWPRFLLLVLIASAMPLSWTSAQTSTTLPSTNLRITAPKDLTSPLPAPVIVSGATGGSRICLTSIRRETPSVSFAGKADYVADASGKVNTGTMKPLHASYAGIDPLGIFWAVESRPALPGDPLPGEVRVTAHMVGAVDVSATARMTPNTADLVVSTSTPFSGAVWARPRTAGRHPVIIILGGSEGGAGAAERYAPIFAAQGYAALGLPYYNPNHETQLSDLPSAFANVPVDRLEQVRDWIAAQPDADVNRLGLYGLSKGAEFVLIAASYEPWVRAVVAVAPSDVVWQGWGSSAPAVSSFSLEGHPLPFQPYGDYQAEQDKRSRGGGDLDLLRIHTAGRTQYPERLAKARIPVERFKGSLLLVTGEADGVWPSAEMAKNIVARRKAAGQHTRLLIFPNAEHGLAGPGTVPLEQVGNVRYATIRARESLGDYIRSFQSGATTLNGNLRG